MTGDELRQWRSESRTLDRVLMAIAREEVAALTALGWPTTCPEIEAVLSGRPGAAQPARRDARARRRAQQAMIVLLNLARVRQGTRHPDTSNACRLAFHAVLAGLYTHDAAANAVIAAQAQARQQRATAHAATDRRARRAEQDAVLRRAAEPLHTRHPEWSWSALAHAIRRERPDLHLAPATIRKRLAALLK